jgi:RNA polymerase sigma factor (TIGR02999 family)
MPARGAPETPVTDLLHAWRDGDQGAFARLLAQLGAELRRMAASRLRGMETPSLASGDLLQESLLKLMAQPPDWQNRAHFFATVSTAMRCVMVDHARARQADKRGGQWQQVTYTLSAHGEESWVADLLTLDQLLNRLQAEDSRAFEVLQLTYFGGLQRDEIAQVLAISVPTVDRELRFARAWLAEQLGGPIDA